MNKKNIQTIVLFLIFITILLIAKINISGSFVLESTFVISCGNGSTDTTLGEDCESPNTQDNIYCTQTTTVCAGKLYGTRDEYGNCNLNCQCIEDSTTYSCVIGECGAECTTDNFNGLTCSDFSTAEKPLNRGNLSCNADCTINISQCSYYDEPPTGSGGSSKQLFECLPTSPILDFSDYNTWNIELCPRSTLNVQGFDFIGIYEFFLEEITESVKIVYPVAPGILILNENEEKEIRLNEDIHSDLKIKLNYILNQKANLTLTKLEKPEQIIISEPTLEKPTIEKSHCPNSICEPNLGETWENCIDCKKPFPWIWLLIILLLLIIIFFLLKKKFQKKIDNRTRKRINKKSITKRL